MNAENSEQLDALLEAAMMLLEKQREKNNEYAMQTRREFISLLDGMKQELTEFSRENIKTELDSVLNGYVGDMEAARKKNGGADQRIQHLPAHGQYQEQANSV